MEERVDSDHFPVVIWIKGDEGGVRKRKGGERVRRRWNWTEKGKGIFRERMEKVWREERGKKGDELGEIEEEDTRNNERRTRARKRGKGEKGLVGWRV